MKSLFQNNYPSKFFIVKRLHLILAIVGLFVAQLTMAQLIKPFTQRTSPLNPGVTVYNVKGDFAMIGNTSLTLQNYGDNTGNNQGMIYVDIDNDPNTVNSSSADLTFSTENGADPSCSEVVYAGLYWTGRASNGPNSPNSFDVTVNGNTFTLNKQQVKLQGPASSGYTTITATSSDIYYPDTSDGYMYSAYAEVTDFVRNNGVLGTYTVADLAAAQGSGGSTGFYGGWGMVVIYSNNQMNLRDITLFDGHAYVAGGVTADFTIPVTGFNSTQNGPVNVKLGVIAGEGDRSIPGDFFQIRDAADQNWVDLAHGGNSPNNFFNSSVFTGGNLRNPDVLNNTGMDIAVFDVPNTNNDVVANNQTSTTFRYGTTQDTYIIFAIVFGVDAYEPEIAAVNSLLDINNGGVPATPVVLPGEELTFNVDVFNTGVEPVTNGQIVIPIPFNAEYVSASGQFLYTPNAGTAPFFDASQGSNGAIVWDLGDLPLPSSPQDILAQLSYTLSATEDCNILNNANCASLLELNGTIAGVGQITGSPVSENFISGFQQSGNCIGNPITTPIAVPIDAAAYVAANCSQFETDYTFIFCGLDSSNTTIPTSQVSGAFPVGTRFFDSNPVTVNSIEYTSTGFPLVVGMQTYYAYPDGIDAPCFTEFTVTVVDSTLTTVPTADDVVYCQNETALPLSATPSDSAYQLFYYTDLNGSPVGQIIPPTDSIGVFTYFVAEALSNNCISENVEDIQVTVLSSGTSVLSGVNGTTLYTDTAVVDEELCFNVFASNSDPNQVVTIEYLGSLPGATFTITPGSAPSAEFCWTPTDLDSGINTFQVLLRDSCGDSLYTFEVVVEAPPCDVEVELVRTGDLVCDSNDGVAVLTAVGGVAPYTFSVINNTTGEIFTNTTGVFLNLTAGDYSVVVIDSVGCEPDCSDLDFTIGGSAVALDLTLVGTNVLCADSTSTGGSIAASVTGGTPAYVYSIDGNFGTDSLFTGLATGLYTVTVLDQNGCTTSGDIEITAPDPLVINIIDIQEALCNEDNGSFSFDVIGGTTPYAFTINGNALSSGSAVDLAPGVYTLEVVDSNDCVASVDVEITTPDPLVVSLDSIGQPSCIDTFGSVQIAVSGGSAPYTYDIGNGPTTSAFFDSLAVGSYTVVVTDSTNCVDSISFDIVAPEDLVAEIQNVIQPNCVDTTGGFEVVVLTGNAPYTYDIGNGPQLSGVFAGLSPGSYNVLVEDSLGCSFNLDAVIDSVTPLVADTANVIDPACGNSNGSFEVVIISGSAPFSYDLNGAITTDNVFDGLASGTYVVVVSDSNQCTDTVDVTLNGTSAFTLEASITEPTCFEDCNGSASVTASVSGLSFIWSNGETSAAIDSLCAGTYTVIGTDDNGCADTLDVVVTQPDAISLFLAEVIDEACDQANGSATIQAQGGTSPYTYFLAGLSQTQVESNTTGFFGGLESGTYAYYVTDSNGCEQECIETFELFDDCNPVNRSVPAIQEPTRNVVIPTLDYVGQQASIQYESTVDNGLTLNIIDANGIDLASETLRGHRGEISFGIERFDEGFVLILLKDSEGMILATGRLPIMH